MIIGDLKANKHPFTPWSTLELMPGLTLAPERVVAAILYPRVEKNAEFRIKRLTKKDNSVELVTGTVDEEVFSIVFPTSKECKIGSHEYNDAEFCAGYAVQSGCLCGCMTVDSIFVELLKSLPCLEFEDDAFVFSPAVCRTLVTSGKAPGGVSFNGEPVSEINFISSTDNSNPVDFGVEDGMTTIISGVKDKKELGNPIKTISINGATVSVKDGDGDGECRSQHIRISPSLDCGIRVITETSGLVIGRYSEL